MMHLFDFLTQTHGAESVMAIAPLVWAAIMAAASGAKAATSDKAKADAERRYQTETARWSPWTGLQSKMVADPSVTNAMLQGGISGFSFGQGLENDKVAAALQQAEINNLDRGGKSKTQWKDIQDYLNATRESRSDFSDPRMG